MYESGFFYQIYCRICTLLTPDTPYRPNNHSLYSLDQADLFSFGMLLYHIIGGVFPLDGADNTICIATGGRPTFDHQEYSVLPHFAHLEGLMRKCWKDSPTDRPSAEKVLDVMQDGGFLCLRHVAELDSESEGCVYAQQGVPVSKRICLTGFKIILVITHFYLIVYL